MKRRGLASFDITITNYQNYQYYAPLYLGTNSESLDFVWDTGSSMLWVPLNSCSGCPSGSTKYTAPASYVPNGVTHTINYASGSVSGNMATDDVRLLTTLGAVNMRILGVDTASDITGLRADGIMGMSPKVSSSANAELFVEKLFDGGIIEKNAFGVNYRSFTDTAESEITLGGYDTTMVANDSLFSWVDLKSTSHWNLELKQVYYNGNEIDISPNLGILDTGTSLTLFETNDFNTLWAIITEGKSCGFSTSSGLRA
mmetsp:Transcript_23955/g.26595  ORF Transcript_23955/g.26595 Transcript_23955/m.26595 type:complete len:257 (-) Transcript_23955:375-1145(-)|eukprot:CAMPEP_0205808894 /NCGR_PEP_ID=MMETSP0205-20121125/12953_1 /ASSEMBLY_ACC=CAM_ASM_000278 /TAXON_ID=36767 /ORGANISM="Euplotes focardii, Strain TN1" /LENGTH=256 /DNA_ID=CAMNT_0053085239 /DNA_START=131 /DNA_END=901 /DNA_ORIENTATION=+